MVGAPKQAAKPIRPLEAVNKMFSRGLLTFQIVNEIGLNCER